MPPADAPRIAYVLKRFPRYSETFIVNEILAHEAAGLELEIFSLRPPTDTHFAEQVARVRAPVTYLPDRATADEFRSACAELTAMFGCLDSVLRAARKDGLGVSEIVQALCVAREARRRGITHLHAHFATSATTVARLAARIAGFTYSFTAHAKDIFHESVSHRDLERKIRSAAAVVTVSDFNCGHFQRTFGDAAARVTRIYNGLDLNRFRFVPPTDRAPAIVAVGRLVEKKGFDDLIEACSLLARRGRPFTCKIIGGGERFDELADSIRRLNLQDVVELLGPRPQSEVVRFIREAAVLAAPCVVGADGNRDGLPTVIVEAMALGTPCVATPVTGIPEAIDDGVTGLLVPERDPRALAAAIERLLDDSALRQRLAERARRRIETDFDLHRNTASLRGIFQTAASAPRHCSAPALQEVG